MGRYNVILSQDAEIDLQEYIDYIMFDCKAPLTALKHYEDLFDTLKSLERFPESYPVQTGSSFLLFGTNVRRINYKKMAIIYTVHGDIVYIHRYEIVDSEIHILSFWDNRQNPENRIDKKNTIK